MSDWITPSLRQELPPPIHVDVADRVLQTLAHRAESSRPLLVTTVVACVMAVTAVAYAVRTVSTAVDPLAAAVSPVQVALSDG